MPTSAVRVAALLTTALLGAACAPDPPGSGADGSPAGSQAAALPVPTPATTDVFRIDSVAEGVWVAEVLPRPEAYAFANAVVVAGDSALLVIDTQQSPSAARALIAWIQERFDQPVRWVVNSHYHGDHVNGNVAYRATWPGVRFVAHASVPEAIRTDGQARIDEELATLPQTLEQRQAWLDGDTLPQGQELTPELRERLEYSVRVNRGYLTELASLEVVVPGELVTAPRSLPLGRRTVEVIPVGPAHTRGDVVVHVPDAGVLAVGDLLEDAAPWIDGADLHGWAAALATVQELEPEVVVPSHGAAARGPALLEGEAPLFAALAAAADSVAGESDADDDEAVAAVVAALEPHRAFLASVGVEGEAFTEWAEAAAAQALAEAAGG